MIYNSYKCKKYNTIMALLAVGASLGTRYVAEKAAGSTIAFFTNKNRREEIRLLQENWDALQTKNEMLKEFLKNTLLPHITKSTHLLNELVIFQNQLLIGNGQESMFYLGSDKVRAMLLDTLKEMREFIRKKVIFNDTLEYSYKNPREYLQDSREEFAKCQEGTGNLSKVILYHLKGIDSIIKQACLEELVNAENRAQIAAMSDSPNTVLGNYKKGYNILLEIIKTYENIEYLVTPVNDKMVFIRMDRKIRCIWDILICCILAFLSRNSIIIIRILKQNIFFMMESKC